MHQLIAIILTVIGLVAALPAENDAMPLLGRSKLEIAKVCLFATFGRSPPLTINSQFDNLNTSVEPALSMVPVPYDGLNFTNFGLQPAGIDGLLPGVEPQSTPNYIVNGPRSRLTGGLATFSVVGTSSASFKLSQFYYGCLVADQAQQAQLSTACTFTATGHTKAGKTVPLKTFKYAPNSLTNASMELATFDPTWTGLTSVVLTLTKSPVTVLLTVLAVDTVEYSLN